MTTTRETDTSTNNSTQLVSDIVEAPNKLLPPAVFRRWVHAREEDKDGVEVYKPHGTPMPPAFARDGFEMRKDGRFVQDVIGAADGIERIPGHWRPAGTRRVAAYFASARQKDYAFEIVSVDETVLRRRLLSMPEDAPRMPAEAEARLQRFYKLPPSTSWRRINFERAEVQVLESFPPQYVLVVSGTKPFLNMEVDLEPVVYVRQPEYWEIEVLGRLRGATGLTAVAPYTVSLSLGGAMGSIGVEVLGATSAKRIPVLSPGNES
ncbi:MAG: hypothetical protein M3442_05350 [Chloroflexota bacterium]|nr:hypothetical protein [Chloroflexota bacterium]